MNKRSLYLIALTCVTLMMGQTYNFRPHITDQDLEIMPRIGETCYQYAERKVNEMIRRYYPNRIVGTNWLSAYWAHHYEGALIYRNYFWQPV